MAELVLVCFGQLMMLLENDIKEVLSLQPTFVFLKDGREKAKFSGADVAKLKETLDSYA